MRLSIKERLIIQLLIPRQANYVTMLTITDLDRKINITNDEAQRIDLRADTTRPGNVIWGWADTELTGDRVNDIIIDVEFSRTEIQILIDEINELDKKNQITRDQMDVIKKIRNERTD